MPLAAGANRRWPEPVVLAATTLAAALLYAATREAILAAFLPCLHGGWGALQTGFCILHCDPNRPRTRTCFLFHLAAACWRAAVATILSFLVAMPVAVLLGFKPNERDILATLFVVPLEILLNMVLGLAAVWAALACKVRVWVNPGLRAATRGELHRVAQLTLLQSGFNNAVVVVALAVFLPSILLGCLVLAVAVDVRAPRGVDTATSVVGVIFLFAVPLAMIGGYAWLSSRIIAGRPAEAWPELARRLMQKETPMSSDIPRPPGTTCDSAGCSNRATFHLTYVQARRCCRESHLCEGHARVELTPFITPAAADAAHRRVLQGETCFDFELVVTTELYDQQMIYLREVGGQQRVPMRTGIFEATSLDRKLRGYESPRPLTHDATVLIIRALGGVVQDVIVDELKDQIYHARVRIRRADRRLAVDIRPSDALMLAAAFDSPIYSAERVLAMLR